MKKGPPQGRFGGCLIMGRKVMGNAANCSYLCRSCTLRYTSPSLLGICSTYRCDCGQAESGGNAADERAARMLHGPSCRKRRPGARGVFLAAVSFAGMPVFADLTCGLWTIIHQPIMVPISVSSAEAGCINTMVAWPWKMRVVLDTRRVCFEGTTSRILTTYTNTTSAAVTTPEYSWPPLRTLLAESMRESGHERHAVSSPFRLTNSPRLMAL